MVSGAEPRVAVVVPCFNDGRTVEHTVASAVSYREPLEIAVIDDGSDDLETLGVLHRLSVQGVTVIHQDNTGPAGARMAGVHATHAPYVLALDADDLLDSGPGLSSLADLLDSRPDLQLAWGGIQNFGAHEEVRQTGARLDPWLTSYLNDLPATSLIRRDALMQAGGWSSKDTNYEDWDLWMACAEQGFRGERVAHVVYHYYHVGTGRRHDGVKYRHAALYARLRQRHPALFATRRQAWRTSSAPLMLRLALPVIEALPISRWHKTVAAGRLNYFLGGRDVLGAVRGKIGLWHARRG